MKRIILALALVLALTGCAPKVPVVAPVVTPPDIVPAQQASFNAAATHVTYRWQTYAWSGHKWSAKANLLQHNEWGQSLHHPGKTLVVDTTGDIPASWFASHRNVIGVIFYVPGAGGSWKWPSVAGVKSLRAHNVKIGWVWEAGASAISGGRSAGIKAAKTFLAMNAKYGVPAGSPCYFADDYDSSGSAPTAFLDGAASVLGKSRVGLYAGYTPIAYNLTAGASYNIDVNEVRTADWGQERVSVPVTPPVTNPATYHTRAVMRHTAGLYDDAHLTHRIGYARSGGVVDVLNVNRVRTVAHIRWGGHDGFVKYDAMRWLP